MAPRKAAAKSPKAKTTPARRAKAEVVEVTSAAGSNHDGLDAETAQDGTGSGDDSGSEPEAAVTPARKGGKRKASQDEGDEVESPGAKKPKVSSSVKLTDSVTESGSGKKKHAHRNVKVEIPVSTPVTKPSGKHIVFNDDDGPAEFFTPQEAPAQELLDAQLSEAGAAGGGAGEVDEGSDSDDDAPEAVSTQTAAAQAVKSAQAASRAAEKQLEQEKRKRQERDARLKQQAETRKKHQAASEKKAAAAAAHVAEAEASPEPAQRGHLPRVSAAPTRKRLDKRSLPEMLPDDFLEAASDEDDDTDGDDEQEDARTPKKPKSNTLARQMAKASSRRPQDQRVGSTVYRVARRQEDPSLAPKAHRHSQNTKEVLMRRQRPVARKGGFLVRSGGKERQARGGRERRVRGG